MKIYLITNTITGKQYVGKTKHDDVTIRFREHLRESRKPSSRGALSRAIRKYGTSAFTIGELDVAATATDLSIKEQHWIAVLGTYGNGYNLTKGGDGGSYPRSDDTKERMRQSTLSRSSEFWQEHRAITAISNRQPEFREKVSEGVKRYYETHPHPMIGRTHTSEAKQHMRDGAARRDNTHIGHYERTEEIRSLISRSRRGLGAGARNAMSNPAHRAKVSASKIGKRLHLGPNGERKLFMPGTAPVEYTLARSTPK